MFDYSSEKGNCNLVEILHGYDLYKRGAKSRVYPRLNPQPSYERGWNIRVEWFLKNKNWTHVMLQDPNSNFHLEILLLTRRKAWRYTEKLQCTVGWSDLLLFSNLKRTQCSWSCLFLRIYFIKIDHFSCACSQQRVFNFQKSQRP